MFCYKCFAILYPAPLAYYGIAVAYVIEEAAGGYIGDRLIRCRIVKLAPVAAYSGHLLFKCICDIHNK